MVYHVESSGQSNFKEFFTHSLQNLENSDENNRYCRRERIKRSEAMKTKTFLTLLFFSLAGRSHMIKKILARVVLCSSLVSSWSCVAYRWEQKPLEIIRQGKREGLKICAVQKKS